MAWWSPDLDLGRGNRSHLDDRAIGQHHFGRGDAVADRSAHEKTAPRCIAADHAADRARHGIGRIGAEATAPAGQVPVELSANHAGLHPHRIADTTEDAPHETRAVDDDSPTERPATHARAAATGMNAHAMLGGPAHRRDHVVRRPRPHDGDRPLFKKASVGGVEGPADVVADHITRDDTPKVFLDACVVGMHGFIERGMRYGAVDAAEPTRRAATSASRIRCWR